MKRLLFELQSQSSGDEGLVAVIARKSGSPNNLEV